MVSSREFNGVRPATSSRPASHSEWPGRALAAARRGLPRRRVPAAPGRGPGCGRASRDPPRHRV